MAKEHVWPLPWSVRVRDVLVADVGTHVMSQTPRLEMIVDSLDGAARAGFVRTQRGSFAVPCFMPVGTRGVVRSLSVSDLESLGIEVMLANTYHLALRPGVDIVEEMGGIHGFTGWSGHVLTDSGGFQAYSLPSKIDEDGITFKSVYDGSAFRMTPESAVDAQERLGSDIQMVLDVCPALPASSAVIWEAVHTTLGWAERSLNAHSSSFQAIFGIVQGGIDVDARSCSAKRTAEMGFDGYGIGGLSVGEDRADMLRALEATLSELPDDRPRYLMGVGDPVGLIEAVALGVDMFDCVIPTRLARHGTVLTSSGRMSLRNAKFAKDPRPLDESCVCSTCVSSSRAYLRHLLLVSEPTVLRLLTVHNLVWMMLLMRSAREAIRSGTYDAMRAEIASVWRGSSRARTVA